jgi:hypothetical protein
VRFAVIVIELVDRGGNTGRFLFAVLFSTRQLSGSRYEIAFSGASITCCTVTLEEAMTVTLKLKPEVETGPLTQAQAIGMTWEDYLLVWWKGRSA